MCASASVSVTLLTGRVLRGLRGLPSLHCGNRGDDCGERCGEFGHFGDRGIKRDTNAFHKRSVGEFAVCRCGEQLDGDAAAVGGRLDGGQTVNVEPVVDLGGYWFRCDGIRVVQHKVTKWRWLRVSMCLSPCRRRRSRRHSEYRPPFLSQLRLLVPCLGHGVVRLKRNTPNHPRA